MAILSIEGFDTYNVVSDTLSGWTSNWSCSFLPQISLPAGRYGNQSLFISAGGGQENVARVFPWVTNRLTVGFDYRNASGINGYQMFLLSHSIDGNQIYAVMDATGHISIYRGFGSTLLGTSSVPIVVNTWTYIEVGVFIHDTLGTIDVWQDGVLTLHLTGQDTKQSTGDRIDTFTIFESGLCNWDNMYWADTIASIGPMKVIPLIPQSDKSVTGYTAVGATGLWDCVDEAAADSDSTYITSSAANDHATFGYGTVTAATVTAIQVNMVAKKSDAGARSIAAFATDGSNNESGAVRALSTSYARYGSVLNTAPDGSAWTAAKVNAADIGVITAV